MSLDTANFGKITVTDRGNKNTSRLLQLGEDAANRAAMSVSRSGDAWEFVAVSPQDEVIVDANQRFLTELHAALQGSDAEIEISTESRAMKQ